jgi:CHAD domain-containing protein
MKVLKIYLKKRKEAIDRILRKPKEKYSPATFHRLRIEIKKLNAFTDLIKFCSKDFNKKDVLKPFNLIFHQAGKVRELRIQEAMLKSYFRVDFLKEYRNRLKKHRIKEQDKYFSIADKKFAISLKKKFREIGTHLTRVDEIKVNLYMENRRKQIQKLLHQDTLVPSQVHMLRKRLKRFNYNSQFLNPEKPNNPLPEVDALPEILGDWRNCQILIKHLESAINNVKMNPVVTGQLEKIKSIVSYDCELLFKEILETIKESEFLPIQPGEITPPKPMEKNDQ